MASRRRATRGSITGTISDIQRRLKYLSAQPAPSRLSSQVVQRSNIRARAVSNDQIALDAVSNDQIQANAIREAQLQDDAVTTAKIEDLAVTTGKIANSAVTDGQLATDSVLTDKIKDLQVVEGKIAGSAVTRDKIRNSAVDDDKLADDAVRTNKIRNSAVTSSKIDNGAVSRDKIAGRAVGNGELADGSVSSGKIGSGQVTDSKIASISGSKVGSGIRGQNINNSSISNSKLSDGTRAGTGLGLRKSGNTISVNFDIVSSNSHSHTYTNSFYAGVTHPFGGTPRLTSYRSNRLRTSSASSRRFKKSISNHSTVDPKKLLLLELKKFKYKRHHSRKDQTNKEWEYGYMVEDLLDLGFDEPIHYDKENNPEALDYGLFSALVLELVKVQQEEISSLQEKVKNLEGKNDV